MSAAPHCCGQSSYIKESAIISRIAMLLATWAMHGPTLHAEATLACRKGLLSNEVSATTAGDALVTP